MPLTHENSSKKHSARAKNSVGCDSTFWWNTFKNTKNILSIYITFFSTFNYSRHQEYIQGKLTATYGVEDLMPIQLVMTVFEIEMKRKLTVEESFATSVLMLNTKVLITGRISKTISHKFRNIFFWIGIILLD